MRWKKFLRWQFAEGEEAANTDLSNVFQICSSGAAFGFSEPAGESGAVPASTIAGSAKRIHDHL
jgi:hypothetical protein